VIFVGAQNNYAHYLQISKRLGSNIEPFINNGVLVYIDLFNALNDWIAQDIPYTEETTSFWTQLPGKAIKLGPEKTMTSLLTTTVKNIGDSLKGRTGNTCIIFDNISLFFEDTESTKTLCSMINSLWDLSQNDDAKPNLYLTVTRNTLSPENEKLLNIIKKSADCLLEVFPNPGGFSKDISGQLKFSGFGEYKKNETQLKYKLNESKVDIFEYFTH